MKFEKKVFVNETIDIDFGDFSQCRFEACTLVYNGYGPVGLDRCSFNNSSWAFNGAAAKTIAFLTALYGGADEAGAELVEQTFANIRGKHAYVIVDTDGNYRLESGKFLYGPFQTQLEAINHAKAIGLKPLVARVRHLNDKSMPDHWRAAD